jgi:hypothetical protein
MRRAAGGLTNTRRNRNSRTRRRSRSTGTVKGMTDAPPTMLDTAQAQAHLYQRSVYVSRESLQRWAAAGKLQGSIKLPNGQWRHSTADLDAVIADDQRQHAAHVEGLVP